MRAQILSGPIALVFVAVAVGCSPPTRTFANSSSGQPSSTGSGGSGTGGSSTSHSGAGGSTASTSTSSGGMQTPLFTAGSRLRPVVFDATGAQALQHWQDLQLHVPCQFLATNDSQYHCVPLQTYTIAYADAACTQMVAVPPSCGTSNNYAVNQAQNGSCEQTIFGLASEGQASVYNVGSMAGNGQTYVLQGTPPNCYSQGSPTPYYNVTPATLGSFVTATLKKVPADNRLDAEILEAADGTTQITGDVYDHAMSDQLCSLQILGDPNLPSFLCLPGTVASVEPNDPQYTDASCKTQVASMYSSGGCPSANVIAYPSQNQTACNAGTTTYYAPANQVTPTQLCSVDGTSMSCTCNQNISTSTQYYTLGTTIPASTFAPMQLSTPGTGRLRTVTLTTQSGAPLTNGIPDAFWDMTVGAPMGTACQVKNFSDGVMRCVTQDALTLYSTNTPFYADSACTIPVASTYVETNCPVPTPTTIVTITPAMNNCGLDTVTLTSTVNGMVNANSLYTKGTTAPCVSTTGYSNNYYFAVGTTVDPSTLFATVTQKTL